MLSVYGCAAACPVRHIMHRMLHEGWMCGDLRLKVNFWRIKGNGSNQYVWCWWVQACVYVGGGGVAWSTACLGCRRHPSLNTRKHHLWVGVCVIVLLSNNKTKQTKRTKLCLFCPRVYGWFTGLRSGLCCFHREPPPPHPPHRRSCG